MIAQDLATTLLLTTTVSCVLGALLALFSYFIDFCLWRGNIFDFYPPYLAKIITKRFYKAKFDNISKITDKEVRNEAFIDAVNTHGFFKMLGGCAICFNVWIGFFTFPLIHIAFGISFWYMPVYLLFASFLLRKMMKID